MQVRGQHSMWSMVSTRFYIYSCPFWESKGTALTFSSTDAIAIECFPFLSFPFLRFFLSIKEFKPNLNMAFLSLCLGIAHRVLIHQKVNRWWWEI